MFYFIIINSELFLFGSLSYLASFPSSLDWGSSFAVDLDSHESVTGQSVSNTETTP